MKIPIKRECLFQDLTDNFSIVNVIVDKGKICKRYGESFH